MLSVNEIQRNHLEEFGYVIFDDVFDSSTLNIINNLIEKLGAALLIKRGVSQSKIPTDLSRLIEELKRVDVGLIGELYDCIASSPEFLRNFACNPQLCGIASGLLDQGSYDVFKPEPLLSTPRIRIDPPFDQRRLFNWHQEIFYAVPKARYLQFWAPMMPKISEQDGALQIIPKSHKYGILPTKNNDREGRPEFLVEKAAIEDVFRKSNVVPLTVELQFGQVVVFSGTLVHRPGNNSGPNVRLTLLSTFYDIEEPNFLVPKPSFAYRGITPEEYYDEVFGS